VREKPDNTYWDLAEAAWVIAEDDGTPAQSHHVEDDLGDLGAGTPQLIDSPAD
jgi:hypothetical protein